MTKQEWADFIANQEKQNVIALKLVRDRGISFIAASIIAGDKMSAERATLLVKEGMPPEKALNYIGSYSRFDWAVENLPKAELLKMLPVLWVGADPDDTTQIARDLWLEAFEANGKKTVVDDWLQRLPQGDIRIFRGQVGDTLGISWTRDIEIAKKFAATGGGRMLVKGGKVLTGVIQGSQALAYLTLRGESEVIVDPRTVSSISEKALT